VCIQIIQTSAAMKMIVVTLIVFSFRHQVSARAVKDP